MFTDDTKVLRGCVNLGMNAFTSSILVFSIILFLWYFGYKRGMPVSYFKTNLTLFFLVRFLPHLVCKKKKIHFTILMKQVSIIIPHGMAVMKLWNERCIGSQFVCLQLRHFLLSSHFILTLPCRSRSNLLFIANTSPLEVICW